MTAPPAPPLRIALAGAGAFGRKHLDALAAINDARVAAIVSRRLDQARQVAAEYGAQLATTDLAEVLERDDIDAVILCTPTPLHAEQAVAVLRAGKHVQVEIPLADSWAGTQCIAAAQRESGLTCMAGHTRRFNRSSSLSDSDHRPASGRERSSAAWSGGHPRRPVAVFRHRAVAAAKPSGNPPSLARVRRGGAQGVALTPRSIRSRRCHTCPSAHLRVFSA